MTRSPYPMLCVTAGCLAIAAFFSSCSTDLPVQRSAQREWSDAPALPYSIVFIIHGDGEYLYHDTSGTARSADEEALAGARMIALRNPRAEVFIFHQIPRNHVLFFFSIRDGEFSYYRNGRLVAHELYWRDTEHSHFEPEMRLYRAYRVSDKGSAARVFVYCGHEIPEIGGAGYDASYPDRAFTVDDLAEGLKTFTGDSAKFDLVILSTCFGGTPHSISALGSYARYIVASPDNLHLSYFNLHPLERLDMSLANGDVRAFAERFARRSFDRLAGDLQTAVSVAVYDPVRVKKYVDSVRGLYDRDLTTLIGMDRASAAAIQRCDCADIPDYVLPGMNEGVQVLYRPANFGRGRLKKSHSGWECWRTMGAQPAPSQRKEQDPETKFTQDSLSGR